MCQGAVSIDGDTVTRNLAYYAMAHFSKLVRPGSVRIASGEIKQVANVAFKTAAGRIILVVANTSNQNQLFSIRYKGRSAQLSIPAASVATYYWE